MFLGILVLITALSISAVAIYYSVAGLVAIFAAAALPIMIMGGVLEIGKLVTAVWLHRYWREARWWLKSYLSLAVVVLMFITSMGIFGFLSKAHIEQTANAEEGIAQIERIDDDLARLAIVIERAEQRIEEAEASVGEGNTAIQAQIDKEQERIDTAYERIQPAIDEQNAIIQTQLDSLEDRVAVYTDEIARLNTEKQRLEDLVAQYRTELANTDVASVEAQIQPYNDQIAQLDADLERINTQANEYEQRINEVNIDTSAVDALQQQIATIEENIVVTTNKLQSRERAKIQEGQAVIGVTSDGLFGGNTRRALATWVEAQQERIAGLQSQAVELRTQAQSTLDAERSRLTDIVRDLRGPQTDQINQRKQSLLDAIDQVRSNSVDEARTERARIQQRIDNVLNTDIPNVSAAIKTAQDAITDLRQADDGRINAARQAIKDARAGADAQIAASNELIQRLRDNLTVGSDPQVEAVVQQQQQKIIEANNSIDTLTENKYALQAEYRKLEAEVGPVKYLAEFVYGERADQDLLEEAVRWVILIIIFVFDPLAVLLLIASQATFEMRKAKREVANGDRLRLEREEYERQRAQKIIDNPGFNVDPPLAAEEEKINDHTDRLDDGGHVEQHNQDRTAEDRESTDGDNTDISDHDAVLRDDVRTTDDGRDTTEGMDDGYSQERQPDIEDLETIAEREEQYKVKESNPEFNTSKTAWKKRHPKETIKFHKTLYIKGLIDELPWERSEYVQNAEQNENSLFNRLGDDKSDQQS
jgi:peptidoglycan hydrolase CwlO-like protein